MNLDFPEHCLFCLGNIVQQDDHDHDQQVHSNSSQDLNGYGQNNSNHLVINSMTKFNCNFERLCKYLKIDFPVDTLKFRNVSRILSGEKRTCYEALLCGSCVEMVNGLHRLHEDLRRIQRRIDYGIKSVQSVMRGSDGDGEEEEGDEERKGRNKRKLDRDSLETSSSVVADYLEFVETFRKLVKEVEIEEPKPVVLTGEAGALAKCYEKLEEDLEMNDAVKTEEDEEGPQADSNSMQNAEGNGEDAMFQILSSVSVSMETNEDTNEGDDDGLHLYSTDMEIFTGSEENTMDSTTTPCGSTTSGDGVSFTDPLSPTTATSSSSNHRSFKVTFNCRYCDLVFDNPKTYYYHRKGMHAEESEHLVIPSYHEDGPVSVTRNVQIRTCPICGENKKTKQNTLKHFMEHMLSHEVTDNPVTTVSQDNSPAEEDKPFVCDYCDQRFLMEMNLDLHKICYHESSLLIPLKCEDCGDKSSNSWEDLVTHLVEQHGGGEGNQNTIYSCKSCPMAFTSADQFLAHMQTHSLSKRLPCCECPCVSPSLKELYQHFNESHPDLITNLKCEVCHEVFLMPNTYRKHFATVHSTKVPNPTISTIYVPNSTILTSPSISIISTTSTAAMSNIQCPHCLEPKTFKNKLTLDNHIRIHHDTTVTKHSCNQCGKAFVHKSTLRYHIQQVHLGIRYSCPHCPKSFTAKSLLKGHIKLHNGQGPPVISCLLCGKIFASQTALKTHTITQHGNNEPRACDVCGREFQNIFSLRAHKSDVHNIKQWSCPHCTQQFARVKQFEKHLATHNLQLVAVDVNDIVE